MAIGLRRAGSAMKNHAAREQTHRYGSRKVATGTSDSRFAPAAEIVRTHRPTTGVTAAMRPDFGRHANGRHTGGANANGLANGVS